MPAPRAAKAVRVHHTRALLARRTTIGEGDLIILVFTEGAGLVSAMARGARRSQRRFAGALEPFHTLMLRLEERADKELLSLAEASLADVRTTLVSDLGRLDAAGRAMNWIKHVAPPRTPEPELWKELTTFLDELDTPSLAGTPEQFLAAHGFRLLAALGWGLDLSRCVRCGKPCEENRTAMIDAVLGGLVCRSCGGAAMRLSAAQRRHFSSAAAGTARTIELAEVPQALGLVERALQAHAGV